MAVRSEIRVVLADDHAMVREALAQILKESGCIRVRTFSYLTTACRGLAPLKF